jgi:hypothetical protein
MTLSVNVKGWPSVFLHSAPAMSSGRSRIAVGDGSGLGVGDRALAIASRTASPPQARLPQQRRRAVTCGEAPEVPPKVR